MPLTSNAQTKNAQTNSHRIALAEQHMLQSDDLMQICHLANVAGIVESLESWSFEQFFGFTLHLFITTESSEIRTQVAQILPKFGSKIVLPLVKISHHFQGKSRLHEANTQGHYQVSMLAQQSAVKLTPEALCFGLQAVLLSQDAAMLLPVVGEILIKLPEQRHRTVLSCLNQLLPEKEYGMLEHQLVTECSRSQFQKSFETSSTAEQNITTENNTQQPHKEVHLVA
ncbi:MAG: hypothetical protein AAGC93_11120 [Cyanobacteria bacterium P01_F01_bin.53]